MNIISKINSKLSKLSKLPKICNKIQFTKLKKILMKSLVKLKVGTIIFLEIADFVLYIIDLFIIKMPLLSLLIYIDIAIIVCSCFTVLFTDAFYKINEYIVDKLFEDNTRIGIDTFTTAFLLAHLNKYNKVRPE